MSQIAILADIHGNSIALQAVLDDIRQEGSVEAYWVLGDLAAIGHDPIRVLETLNRLPNLQMVRGNTESYMISGKFVKPLSQAIQEGADSIKQYVQVSKSLAWTQGALTLTGWMQQIEQLPLEMRHTLPDGTRILGVHAAPGSDDGTGITPNTTTEILADYALKANADLVCVGHTHWPIDLEVQGVRFFNPGSVSNPFVEDLGASYAILEAHASGYHIERRSVNYDHQAVIEAVKKARQPAADYIIDFQLGKNKQPWQ